MAVGSEVLVVVDVVVVVAVVVVALVVEVEVEEVVVIMEETVVIVFIVLSTGSYRGMWAVYHHPYSPIRAIIVTTTHALIKNILFLRPNVLTTHLFHYMTLVPPCQYRKMQ